jgi:prepilin-type N-terminal cleavage/methylation domain-containing protein
MKMLNTNTGISAGRQSGFTLIEIAIVLVIIGLLLGGVLKGQELITTARVHALNNTVDGITAAWFSFQDRYRAYPGDYLDAQSKLNLPGAPAGGDGNGLVGTASDSSDTPNERGAVWIHLEAAGYLTGGYVTPIDIAGNQYGCSPINCPENGFGSGMVLSYGTMSYGEDAKGAAAVKAHELITGRGIPVQVLAELDRKVDDGLATSGAMQLGINGAGWTGSANCLNGANYQLQTPSSDCAAVFRNF